MTAISGNSEDRGPHKSTNQLLGEPMNQRPRPTLEELGELMFQDFLWDSAAELSDGLIALYFDELKKRPALRVSPRLQALRNQLVAVQEGPLNTVQPGKLDIPKAIKDLEGVMRAPIEGVPVEQSIAAVVHRLLTYELEHPAEQTEGETV